MNGLENLSKIGKEVRRLELLYYKLEGDSLGYYLKAQEGSNSAQACWMECVKTQKDIERKIKQVCKTLKINTI